MHVAIPLYPGFTALDAVGPYTVFAFAPGWQVTLVAAETGPVLDDRGRLGLVATATYDELPRPDVIMIPGGPGAAEAMTDQRLLDWVRQAHDHARWTTSVCSGSFVLGAAGLINGRRATSHWGWRDQLAAFDATPVAERIVFDGSLVTAAGVSAGIDMSLALLGEAAGETIAQTVQLTIEYAPEPPFDAGTPETAPAELHQPALDLAGPVSSESTV